MNTRYTAAFRGHYKIIIVCHVPAVFEHHLSISITLADSSSSSSSSCDMSNNIADGPSAALEQWFGHHVHPLPMRCEYYCVVGAYRSHVHLPVRFARTSFHQLYTFSSQHCLLPMSAVAKSWIRRSAMSVALWAWVCVCLCVRALKENGLSYQSHSWYWFRSRQPVAALKWDQKQGCRSHRIIGGHKRRLWVWETEAPPKRGPGAQPR